MNSYKKLCTEFYDIDKPRAPKDALDFYLHYAEKASGPILEPMCGSGRFLFPLLKQGFDIDGSDASPYMLQACCDRCKSRGFTPILYEQFLEQIELPRQYGLVIIPSGSFCLVTNQLQIRESLRRIYALMLPGAKFVLEIEQHKGPSISWPWGGRWVERPDGAKILISWLGHYNADQRIAQAFNRYELIKDGQLLETEFEDFDLRRYDLAEFRELLEVTGFKEIKTFKVYALSEPDETDDSVVFECSKSVPNQ